MSEKQKLLGFYNYTVILTYIGMLCGFAGILCILDGNDIHALLCLLLAGFCDMFDGAVASTMERSGAEKCFGIQIDSLSDLVCFGVLPALFAFSLDTASMTVRFAAGLYLLCTLIRLAYFNVDEQERQEISSGPREYYYGLPVTAAALFLPFIYSAGSVSRFPASMLTALLLFFMSVLFLVPFRLKKPDRTGKIGVLFLGTAELVLLVLTKAGV